MTQTVARQGLFALQSRKDKMATPNVRVSAATLLAALIHALSHVVNFVEDLGTVVVDLDDDISMPIAVIRQNLGQTVNWQLEGGPVEVVLPQLMELGDAYGQLPETLVGTSPLREFGFLVGGVTQEQIERGQLELNTLHMAELFAALCQVDQPKARQAFRLIPRALGVAQVTEVLALMYLDRYYPNWRDPAAFVYVLVSHGGIINPEGVLSEQTYLEMRARSVRQASGASQLLKYIRDNPDPNVRQVVEQETPVADAEEPGPGEPGPGEPGPGADPVVGQPVARGDRRVDLSRDAFYRDELHCTGPAEATRPFRIRQYLSYRYVTPTGAVVVIFDCRWTGNAAYLFLERRAGAADPTNWLEYANLTRRQLIALLEAGDPPVLEVFLGRYEHPADGDWREPIRRRLAAL